MQRDSLNPVRPVHGSAFTLLEMVLGLTVLVLVFGAMFRLLDGSLGAMSVTQNYARQHQEGAGLVGFFRAFCMELPRESTLGFKKGEESIRFTNAQIALLPGALEGRVLEFYRDKKTDRLMLREALVNTGRPIPRAGEMVEFALATNVTAFAWAAHDPRNPKIVFTDWQDANKPAYLTMRVRKNGEEIRADFWVPYGLPPGGMPSPDKP